MMVVKELIQKLAKMDPELRVVISVSYRSTDVEHVGVEDYDYPERDTNGFTGKRKHERHVIVEGKKSTDVVF